MESTKDFFPSINSESSRTTNGLEDHYFQDGAKPRLIDPLGFRYHLNWLLSLSLSPYLNPDNSKTDKNLDEPVQSVGGASVNSYELSLILA